MIFTVALYMEAGKFYRYVQDPRLLTIKMSAMQELVDILNSRQVAVLTEEKDLIALSVVGSSFLKKGKIYFNIEASKECMSFLNNADYGLVISECFNEKDTFEYNEKTITLHKLCQESKDSFKVLVK